MHLAQLNIARMIYMIDDPRMADFVDALDDVNAAGEASPGFVWRLQTDAGNATGVRIYDSDEYIINLTVWKSVDDLLNFVRSDTHLAIMRRRREWFESTPEATLVLWWVDAGRLPTIEEAQVRLDKLRAEGPGPEAFNFRHPFPPPG